MRTKFGIGFLGLALLLNSCGRAAQKTEKLGADVRINQLSDPTKLNPVTSSDAGASYIQNHIFSRLLEYNQRTLELQPMLAKDMPVVEVIESGPFKGGMSMSFIILDEATWDNGQPILASDYEFTIKVIKNPRVEATHLRPYIDFIDEIVIDPDNPKKFTIYSRDRYILAESSAGGLHVLPEYVYDPSKLMRQFTVAQLDNPENNEELGSNPDIIRFAEQFNAPEFERTTVIGSGPYRFDEWTSNQRIVLKKKEDWWGDKLKEQREILQAYPPSLIYQFAKTETMVSKIKSQEIDVATVQPQNFIEFKNTEIVTKNYELSTPDQLAYAYLGINMRKPKFQDKRVRRALAHIVNCDEIITTLYEDMARRIVGPINPLKDYYAKDLKELEYNPDKARELLAEAGWTDSDGDGILDKVIEGERVPFIISYKYNSENNIRKNIGLIFSKEAERLGIKVELEGKEWTVFLEDIKQRNFDIMASGWVQSPGNDDLKQIWHSSSDTPDGSNSIGFGNNESDALIEQIRKTLDEEERKKLYYKIQELIYEEQPCIFLCAPQGAVVTHKRFENTVTSALRPGFRENWFKLKATAVAEPSAE